MSELPYEISRPNNHLVLAAIEGVRARNRASLQVCAAPDVHPVDVDGWTDIMEQFADFIPEQSAAFSRSRWGHGNIEFVVIGPRARPLGACSVIVKDAPLLPGIAFIKWGPMYRRIGETVDPERYRWIISQLADYYCNIRGMHLTVQPPAVPGVAESCSQVLESEGFADGNSFRWPARYLVNTAISPEALRTSLDQKWRYNLKKAEKHEFEIRFADDEDGLNTFMKLYDEMSARKGFLDSSPIGSLRDIMESERPRERPRLVLVSHEDQVTAGGVFFTTGGNSVLHVRRHRFPSPAPACRICDALVGCLPFVLARACQMV